MPKRGKKKVKEKKGDDPGFWAAGPNSHITRCEVKLEEGTWLHPSEIMQDDNKTDDNAEVKSLKRKCSDEQVPVAVPLSSPTKSKKRKSNKKKKSTQKLEAQNTSVEDVEQLRDEFESSTEWNMRRSFLTENMGTITLDRLICLSKCFINYEIYGNTYPPEVMLMLTNMKATIADVIPDRKERLKSKYEVEFVKPSNPESQVSDALYKQQKASSKGMINFVKAGASYESITYAKSDNPEDKSEESPSYHPGPIPCQKQGESFSDSKKPDEYGSLYDKMQGRIEIEQKEHKISSMRNALEKLRKSKPNGNVVSQFYEACQKVKISPLAESDLDPQGFSSKVFVDGVLVAESIAKNKKSARSDAYLLACEKILKPYHKFIGTHPNHLTFLCSDQPFDSDNGNVQEKSEKSDSNQLTESESGAGERSVDLQELKRIKARLTDFYFRELNDDTFDFPLNCMHQTCNFLKVTLEFKSLNLKCGKVKCELLINGVNCGHGIGDKAKEAEHEAAKDAVQKLRNMCWTMKYKTIVDTDNDKLSKDSVMQEKEKVSNEIEHGKKLGDSNIGSKLMKMMGWSGGGIGKNLQGREEPVLIDKVVERSGLGADGKSSQKELKNVMFKIVNDYYHSNDDTDIAFAPDFSNFERKVIHDSCRKFGLKSKSYGSGDDRYLVISRQRTPQELYQYVLSKGGETHKYKLIPPLLPEFK